MSSILDCEQGDSPTTNGLALLGATRCRSASCGKLSRSGSMSQRQNFDPTLFPLADPRERGRGREGSADAASNRAQESASHLSSTRCISFLSAVAVTSHRRSDSDDVCLGSEAHGAALFSVSASERARRRQVIASVTRSSTIGIRVESCDPLMSFPLMSFPWVAPFASVAESRAPEIESWTSPTKAPGECTPAFPLSMA
jgi:hypothetical protein